MEMNPSEETPLGQLLPDALRPPFEEASWPTEYFIHHGARERLPEWMRLPELGDVGAIRGMAPFAEVSTSHPDVYAQALLAGTSPATAELIFRFGLTVTFFNVASGIPGARAWLDRLADEVGTVRTAVDMALFCSPAARGLPVHYDANDVFIVQLHGKKTWRVGRKPYVKYPVDIQYAPATSPSQFHGAIMSAGLPEKDPTDLDEVLLEPGTVLFVPRGTWHQTAASDGLSVSASIFLNIPTVGELLLEQLQRVIAQDVRLRAPALGFAGDDRQRERAHALFDEAVAALAENLPALKAQAAFESSASPLTLRERIAATTRFIRDPSVRLDLDVAPGDDGLVRIRTFESSRARPRSAPVPDVLALPPVALPILRWIDERRGVFATSAVLEAFPQFDLGSIAGLLAELVVVRMLVLLPFGERSG